MTKTPDPECLGCEFWRQLAGAALGWLELASRGDVPAEDLVREHTALFAKVKCAEKIIAMRVREEDGAPCES